MNIRSFQYWHAFLDGVMAGVLVMLLIQILLLVFAARC